MKFNLIKARIKATRIKRTLQMCDENWMYKIAPNTMRYTIFCITLCVGVATVLAGVIPDEEHEQEGPTAIDKTQHTANKMKQKDRHLTKLIDSSLHPNGYEDLVNESNKSIKRQNGLEERKKISDRELTENNQDIIEPEERRNISDGLKENQQMYSGRAGKRKDASVHKKQMKGEGSSATDESDTSTEEKELSKKSKSKYGKKGKDKLDDEKKRDRRVESKSDDDVEKSQKSGQGKGKKRHASTSEDSKSMSGESEKKSKSKSQKPRRCDKKGKIIKNGKFDGRRGGHKRFNKTIDNVANTFDSNTTQTTQNYPVRANVTVDEKINITSKVVGDIQEIINGETEQLVELVKDEAEEREYHGEREHEEIDEEIESESSEETCEESVDETPAE